MINLCTNRPEGFGPISKLTAPLPTQCFLDTVLVPAPTALYFLSLPVLFLVTLQRSRGVARKPTRKSDSGSSYRAASVSFKSRFINEWKTWLPTGVYYFLIAVIALMESVEIVQLARARLGVGVLPLVYGGCAAAAALQATEGVWGRLGGFWAASTAFWVASAAMTGVKMAAVARLGFDGRLARQATVYPTVHQFTDLVILGAFYLLAAGGEVGMLFLRRRTRKLARDMNDDTVELRSEFDWK